MGWTWSGRSIITQYPSLLKVEDLLKRWPSLANLAKEMEAKGELPKAIDAASKTDVPKSIK